MTFTAQWTDDRQRVRACSTVEADGCWRWSRRLNGNGYGYTRVGSRTDRTRRLILAHRLSYESFVGPIPEGMFVCHHCDSPPCVNPDHLFLGTHMDNVRDMLKKGREAKGDALASVLPQGKLSEVVVMDLRRRYRAGGVRQLDLANEVGVSRPYMSRLLRGERWVWLESSL